MRIVYNILSQKAWSNKQANLAKSSEKDLVFFLELIRAGTPEASLVINT